MSHLRPTCLDYDPEMFFPEGPHRDEIAAQAKRVCETCPLQLSCLEDALDEEREAAGYRFGVRGGTTPRERTMIEMRRKGKVPAHMLPSEPCGTLAAYRRHIRNGEATCDACRAVNNAENIARRAVAS